VTICTYGITEAALPLSMAAQGGSGDSSASRGLGQLPEGEDHCSLAGSGTRRRPEYSPQAGKGTDSQLSEAGSNPGGERPILTRWRRIFRTSSGTVMTARIRIGAEQRGQTNGSTS